MVNTTCYENVKENLRVNQNGQSRDTGSISAHKTQGKDNQNTTQRTKKMNNMDITKNWG